MEIAVSKCTNVIIAGDININALGDDQNIGARSDQIIIKDTAYNQVLAARLIKAKLYRHELPKLPV